MSGRLTVVTLLGIVGFISAIAFADDPAVDSNTVAMWHFDEGTGNIANDSSSNANNSILSGGKFGNCLSFDGADDYV